MSKRSRPVSPRTRSPSPEPPHFEGRSIRLKKKDTHSCTIETREVWITKPVYVNWGSFDNSLISEDGQYFVTIPVDDPEVVELIRQNYLNSEKPVEVAWHSMVGQVTEKILY